VKLGPHPVVLPHHPHALFDVTGVRVIAVDEWLRGKKVLLFGVPGAFTPGCSKTHLPVSTGCRGCRGDARYARVVGYPQGYIADFAKFKAKGFDELACVSVNDAFVMTAWGEAAGAEGKVRMLADPTVSTHGTGKDRSTSPFPSPPPAHCQAAFTKALGVDIDKTAALGGIRSKRYAAVIEDSVVTAFALEPDGTGLSCSLAPAVLAELK